MNIYRIKTNIYNEVTIAGRTLSRIQDYYIPNIIDIKGENEITDTDFYALIRDDTPLLTSRIISLAKSRAIKNNAPIKIGSGVVTKKDFTREPITYRSPLCTIFSPKNYAFILNTINKRILFYHKSNGVYIMDNSTFIDLDVNIERGACIRPRVTLSGKTVIHKNALISENSHIINSTICKNTIVLSSYIIDSKVGENSSVGPYAVIKNNSNIGNNCRIGDFVEIKNSILKDNVKSAHLTYVGDALVGNNVNLGCGTVFCNYDGKQKHRTTVGDNVFVGANTNLIAPIIIGSDSFIAAGTTVTKNLQPNSFCISRPPLQVSDLQRSR